jgi:putative FmdB family regulatory protein
MPLFEYRCRGCDRRFEMFVASGARPRCPECESSDVQKLLSVFAVSSGESRSSRDIAAKAGCGTCGDPRGPGSCVN